MANPTRAEIDTQIQRVVKLLDETRLFGSVTATNNIISMLDVLYQDVENDFADEVTAATEAVRANVANILAPSTIAACLRPLIKQYMRSVIGRSDLSSDDEMWDEWYRYYADNALRVQSMNFTFGTPAAAAGIVGNGQIVRLTRDQRNYAIESGYIDAKRALCVADYQTGTARGAEVFEIKGQVAARDELQRSGSGVSTLVAAKTADDSLLFNASFQQFSGTAAAPTEITNWTSTATVNSTNYDLDSTNFFRAAPSDGSTSYALNVKATTTLTQKLSLRGTKIVNDRPYLLAVIWNRAVGSGDGTLVCRMGSQVSTTVTVSAQTGWNVTLVPATTGQSNWYRQFQEDDMDIGIQWTRVSGNLLIDEVLFLEGAFFDQHGYWIIPASAATYTPFRVNDQFTWADNAPGAKVQRMLTRGFPGKYLPHSLGSSITLSDPS